MKKKGFFSMLPILVALAWPTMLEQLMQTAVQYIDTAMVGSLGKQATAAVGATSTVNWLVGSTVSAIGVGFLSYIAQAMGAGEKDKAKKASGQAALAVIIVGVFFYGAHYLAKRSCARMDASGREHPRSGFKVFSDFVHSHAVQDVKHYFRYGAAIGRGHKVTDDSGYFRKYNKYRA